MYYWQTKWNNYGRIGVFANGRIRKQIVDTLRNVFVNEKGKELSFLPDPNGRDQTADTTSKQNIIKNIVINCKKNKR